LSRYFRSIGGSNRIHVPLGDRVGIPLQVVRNIFSKFFPVSPDRLAVLVVFLFIGGQFAQDVIHLCHVDVALAIQLHFFDQTLSIRLVNHADPEIANKAYRFPVLDLELRPIDTLEACQSHL
jgi:hypothetical protein